VDCPDSSISAGDSGGRFFDSNVDDAIGAACTGERYRAECRRGYVTGEDSAGDRVLTWE
jgi:hypothetical protein